MKQNSIFWIGFSDLMTGLFFIILVLFIIVFIQLAEKLEVSQGELDKIRELEKAIKELPQEYFDYNEEHRRSSLNRDIQFPIDSADIPESDVEFLVNAGKELQDKIDVLYNDFNITYLLVIEGMASRDNIAEDDYNYELSYRRAYALYDLWSSNGITFDKTKCEIQIAGSGIGGIREYSGGNEFRNQRFMIHILPKAGMISDEE